MSYTIEVFGTRLECSWFGSSRRRGAPELVLLHEGLGCVSMWKDFPKRLSAATNLPVFAYSRAGYGGSGPAVLPREPNYMHDEATRVLPALLAAEDIRRVVLVGHSDGASIALIYAARDVTRLAGLVAIAPHVFVEAVSIQAIARAGRGFRAGFLRAALERYHGEQVDDAFWGWHDVWLNEAYADWRIDGDLRGIQVPMLLMQGSHDEYGTLAQLDTIEASCRAACKRVVLEGCGHSPHRERPSETVNAIADFVRNDIVSNGPAGGEATARGVDTT